MADQETYIRNAVRRYKNELIEGQNKGQEALEYVERIRLYYETLSLIEKNKSLGFSTS